MFAVLFSSLVSTLPSLNPLPSTPAEIESLILPYFAPFLAAFGLVSLIYVVYNVRAFNLLADKSEVPLFKTAAKVLLLGALVTIVLGVVFAVLAATGSISFNALLVMAVPGGLVQDIA